MPKKIKIAACQMEAELANVSRNLTKAYNLIEEAFKKGATFVVLPEFFTSAIGFHPDMIQAALPLEGQALKLLVDAAKKHRGYVGGSFIAIKGADRYNTFVLAFPDGSYKTHDKDIPTFWENCYYRGGNDDGVIPINDDLTVGAVLCWEFIRSQTVRRLRGKVDFIIGGSAWWTTPKPHIFKSFLRKVHEDNVQIYHEAFSHMARMVGVPVVHAAHSGVFKAKTPFLPILYESFFLGETQIVDGYGKIQARLRREDGEGVIVAEIEPKAVPISSMVPDQFWIPRLPAIFRLLWCPINFYGKLYYRMMKKRHIY